MFWLNRNKQKSNRNSLIGSIFCIFYRKLRVFPVFFPVFPWFFLFFSFFSIFSVSFETVCFICFASIPKQRVSMFEREYIWVIFRKFRVGSVCFGLLRNSSVCFGCYDIGSKHRNKPKMYIFGFTKQTETNPETDLVSVCFGSNRNLFLFVSRTP